MFKLLPSKDTLNVITPACLFYFNPVITYSTFGIMGDPYVMLAGILVIMLLRSWVMTAKSCRRNILTGISIAFIISISLLYKETILVFLPFGCLVSYLYNRVNSKLLILSLVTAFSVLILLYGYLYYDFTGDVFFKIKQIENSSYFHHCSYNLLPLKYLFIRLTYGVWQQFIIDGFYPVIFGIFIAATGLNKIKKLSHENILPVFFLILFITCLYFPFSLSGYQPLCSDARQYLLLLPLGVLITNKAITEQINLNKFTSLSIIVSITILVCCILSTGNRWEWMIYSLISIFTITMFFLPGFPQVIKYVAIGGILWLSVLERLFFKNSNWFNDMMILRSKITSNYYYFPDHDNMMHWQLLHQFNNRTIAYYNLEKNPFKIFKIY